MDNVQQIAPPRASDMLWRLIIGILALVIIVGGGAWLTYAGIEPGQDVQAAEDVAGSPPASQ